jgi:hypothetical protein
VTKQIRQQSKSNLAPPFPHSFPFSNFPLQQVGDKHLHSVSSPINPSLPFPNPEPSTAFLIQSVASVCFSSAYVSASLTESFGCSKQIYGRLPRLRPSFACSSLSSIPSLPVACCTVSASPLSVMSVVFSCLPPPLPLAHRRCRRLPPPFSLIN